jgi:plastocyanin
MRYKFFGPVLAAAVTLVLTASAHAAQPMAATVHIANFAFGPQVITVAPGATITWVNDDDDAHSVVSDAGAFHSAAMDTADKFSFTFKAAGVYAYHCGLHPHMVAKIVVHP